MSLPGHSKGQGPRFVPALLAENGEFRTFWAGQVISLFGDQITLLALPLAAVLVLHADARAMGYLSAAGWVPYLLFSLHAGAWVDQRRTRRRSMIAADLGRVVLLATIPLAYRAGWLTMGYLYATAFLIGALSVVFFVAYSTLFVSIVPRERYVEGSAILHGSRALSFVGGPSLGGFLVQVFSAPAALAADALSFLVSAFCLARISPSKPPAEPRGEGTVIAGARFIMHSPFARAALAATSTVNFFNFAFSALFVLYATQTLRVQPGILGLVLGTGAVGAVLGSIVTGRLVGRLGFGPTFMLGCVLFPLPLVLVPLAGGPAPLVLACLLAARFGSGLGVMILDISYGSMSAALVPARLRARVSGAYSLVNNGIRPLGSVVGGLLGAAIGLRPTLWVATIGAVAGILWLIPSPMPRLRTLDELTGDRRRGEPGDAHL